MTNVRQEHPTSQLEVSDLPADDAEFEVLFRFALSFEGYRHWGSFSQVLPFLLAPENGLTP